jgi:hypothetical protein
LLVRNELKLEYPTVSVKVEGVTLEHLYTVGVSCKMLLQGIMQNCAIAPYPIYRVLGVLRARLAISMISTAPVSSEHIEG